MQRNVHIALVGLLLFAAGASAQPDQRQPPPYLLPGKTCAVVVKGLPLPEREIKDDRTEAAWFWGRANNIVVDNLVEQLGERHRVFAVEIPHDQGPRTLQHAGVALARHQCSRLIQLTHDVDQDRAGPYFQFTVSVMRPDALQEDPSKFTVGQIKEDYRRAYRFVRSKEVLDTFSMSQFAERMLGDMDKAGALSDLRK